MEGSSDYPNAWAMLLGWGGGQVVRSCPLGVTLSLSREGHKHKLGLWEKLPAQDQAAQCGHYLVKGSQELVKVRGWDTARLARSTRNRLRIRSFLFPKFTEAGRKFKPGIWGSGWKDRGRQKYGGHWPSQTLQFA